MTSAAGAAAAARPRVVLGLPVCNSARFLADTLRSVAAQDYLNLEIVISDDASTDDTLRICHAFAREHRDARVVTQPRRLGWVGNYNALVPHATGEYFAWIPHDDLFEPSYVSELVRRLEQRPDAVLAYSAALFIDADSKVLGRRPGGPVMERSRRRWRRALRFLWWTERQKGLPFRGVIRASALREAGPLPPVRFAADVVWLFRVCLLGAFASDHRPLVRKRKYPGSTSTAYGHTYAEWDEYLRAHRDVIRDAQLPRLEAGLLVAAVWLRRAWLPVWWLGVRRVAASRWGARARRVAARLRKYAAPRRWPDGLRALVARRATRTE